MLQGIAIVVLSILAAVTYGVVHDQFTARICIEYFTIGHPPIFTVPVTSPTIVGLAWGVLATWWVGAGLGVPLAIVARAGKRPTRDVGSLVRPMAILMLTIGALAALAGVAGYFVARSGAVFLPEPMASRIPADKHVAFLTDWFIHMASYLFGAIGGLVLIVMTWRSRAKLAASEENSPSDFEP
ncbi:hypothetical protein NG895_10750 [Aeoliella sp. ICT_H6.2]|uniref:Uncharacterized protein n=1 Tax=Aeoliella straminimaris TaxID=2954799 RepID=A0A9X2JIX3_9BACT|nr:hypothetical protein [Aeoliella straminimaris]MCO6044384.1 hypothetical protein [Aeoliella straminimaris]